MSNPFNIEASVRDADVVIGAVLIPGAKAPKLVTDDMVKQMRPGSVIVDVAVDQGGVIETAGLCHNAYGASSKKAPPCPYQGCRSYLNYTNVTLPMSNLADNGSQCRTRRACAKGVTTTKVTRQPVAGLDDHTIDELVLNYHIFKELSSKTLATYFSYELIKNVLEKTSCFEFFKSFSESFRRESSLKQFSFNTRNIE